MWLARHGHHRRHESHGRPVAPHRPSEAGLDHLDVHQRCSSCRTQPPPLAREGIDPSTSGLLSSDSFRWRPSQGLPNSADPRGCVTPDALGLFRTEKSLCYQIPALALAQEGVVTVVSPLLSLQRDQVGSMRSRGVHEVTLYNSELPPEISPPFAEVKAGFYRIVFFPLKALHSPTAIRWLADEDVGSWLSMQPIALARWAMTSGLTTARCRLQCGECSALALIVTSLHRASGCLSLP